MPLESSKHILLIQPLVGIGDMVWHKPWIDELIKNNKITLATKPTVKARSLFHDAPANFSVFEIKKSMRGKRDIHDGFAGWLRLISDFRALNVDTAILLHHSPSIALAVRLAGIKNRLGYGFKRAARHINAGTPLPPSMRKMHPLDKIKKFSELNGFGLSKPNWKISAKKAAKQDALSFLADKKFVAKDGKAKKTIILGIGAMHIGRQWSAANFAALLNQLTEIGKTYHFILIGGPVDTGISKSIIQQIKRPERVTSYIGDFDTAIALMSLSDGYIGNDTSLLNLMVCLKRPAIGLFTQTPPLTYSPLIHSLDLFTREMYGQPGLIDKIKPSDVIAKAVEVFPEVVKNKPAKT